MDAKITTLLSWAQSHRAYLHPSVEIFRSPTTGLSFRVKHSAHSPLLPWESVVSIPTSLTLSYLDALSPQSGIPSSLTNGLPPYVVGRLLLVREYLRGKDSFWCPYIQALPQPEEKGSWSLPPFWEDEEAAELLEGTNLQVGMEKIKQDVKSEIRSIEGLLVKATDALLERGFTRELYRWAYCIFSSRSFRPSLILSTDDAVQLPEGVGLDDFSVLLPLFDVGNHDMTVAVDWNLEVSASRSTAVVELKTGKQYGPGDQVYNNYSPKSNAELFLGYGFMVKESPELHNDYIHVRKRTEGPIGEEYLISLRPLRDESSILGRYRLSEPLRAIVDGGKLLEPFRHVQPDMVWDIFCTIAPQQAEREKLISIPEHVGAESEMFRERHMIESLLGGRVTEEGRAYLDQVVAIIQNKVMQELERLMETDVEVVGAGEIEGTIKLALDYRDRCRVVLEATLESMGAVVVEEQGEAEEEEK